MLNVGGSASLSTLQSIIDTLIPSGILNTEQKGALGTGVDNKVMKAYKTRPKFAKQIELLVSHVDQLTKRKHNTQFVKLNIDQREQLLIATLEPNAKLGPKQGLEALRRHVIYYYYSSKEGRDALAYTLPSDYPSYPMNNTNEL